jgi:hypothetical protein
VKTWQERYKENKWGQSMVYYMEAEIADLRAQLARKSQGSKLADVVAFLDGSAPLEGIWFGQPHPSGKPWWWRKNLREAMEGAAPPLSSEQQANIEAALHAAVDRECPMPDTPHLSVRLRAIDERAAMWRGIRVARKILSAGEQQAEKGEQ